MYTSVLPVFGRPKQEGRELQTTRLFQQDSTSKTNTNKQNQNKPAPKICPHKNKVKPRMNLQGYPAPVMRQLGGISRQWDKHTLTV